MQDLIVGTRVTVFTEEGMYWDTKGEIVEVLPNTYKVLTEDGEVIQVYKADTFEENEENK